MTATLTTTSTSTTAASATFPFRSTELNQKTVTAQLQSDILRLATHLRSDNLLPTPTGGVDDAWSSIPNQLVGAPPPSNPWASAGASTRAGMASASFLGLPAVPPGLVKYQPPNFTPFQRRGSTSTASSGETSSRVVTPVLDEAYVLPTPLFNAPMIPCSDCDVCMGEDCFSGIGRESTQSQVNACIAADFGRVKEGPTPTAPAIKVSIPIAAPRPIQLATIRLSPSLSPTQDAEVLPRDPTLNWDTRAMVNEGVDLLLWRGAEALVDILIELGARDYLSVSPTATIVHTMLKELSIRGIHKSKELRVMLRFGVLGSFRDHWRVVSIPFVLFSAPSNPPVDVAEWALAGSLRRFSEQIAYDAARCEHGRIRRGVVHGGGHDGRRCSSLSRVPYGPRRQLQSLVRNARPYRPF